MLACCGYDSYIVPDDASVGQDASTGDTSTGTDATTDDGPGGPIKDGGRPPLGKPDASDAAPDSTDASDGSSSDAGKSDGEAGVPVEAGPACNQGEILCANMCIPCSVSATAADRDLRRPVCSVSNTCGTDCVPGIDKCNGFCIDKLSSPANCGSCGRSCAPANSSETGVCASGECVPEARLSSLSGPGARLASDGSQIFFQDKSKIYRCANSTCTSPTLLYTDANVDTVMGIPMTVAGPGSTPYVYFATRTSGVSRMSRCPTTGCTTPTAWCDRVPTSIAADSNGLFFSDAGQVWQSSHASATYANVTYASGNVSSMAVSQNYLFYVEEGVGLRRCPRSTACAPTTISAFTETGTHPVTVNNESLYWAENVASGTKIYSCPAASCVNPTLIYGGSFAWDLASDGRGVYWGGNAIFACLNGGAGCASGPGLHTYNVPSASPWSRLMTIKPLGNELVWTYALNGTGTLQRVTAIP